MPELPEVHRAAHFLRLYLVTPGPHTLTRVTYHSPPDNKNPATTTNDPKIFDTAKTGLDVATFKKKLEGKRIKDVGRLGKYFWLEMESPPHPLFHFGMTGWIKYKGSKGKGVDYWEGKTEGRNGEVANKKGKKEESEEETRPQEVPEEEWPPRFTKVLFEATSEKGEVTEFAFVDGRRFSKIQLLHPEKEKSCRETEPLAANGPDPVLEAEKVTPEWLGEVLSKRKVPIKVFLLDQHGLSGVGNWVADEVLFHAGIHPEAHANTLNEKQIERLVEQLKKVCKTAAVDALGDSHAFPDDWLMRHRWRLDKTGNSGVLPSGEKIIRITVGGRTSAVVPGRQGHGPGGVDKQEDDSNEEADEAPAEKKSRKRKSQPVKEESESDEEQNEETSEDEKPPSKSKRTSKRSSASTTPSKTKKQTAAGSKTKKSSMKVSENASERRSTRRSSRK